MDNTDRNNKNSKYIEVGLDNTGMRTPPTNVPQQFATPARTFLSANTPAFIPTSSLLSEARDVLYLQNPQNPIMTFFPASGYCEQNVQNSHNQYTTGVNNHVMPITSSQPTAQRCQQQQQPTIPTTTSMNTNTNVKTVTDSTSLRGAGPEDSGAPRWVTQIMQNLDSRLNQIEHQLTNQNAKWQNMDTVLQNQNARMTGIEQQVMEINSMKQSMASLQISAEVTDNEVKRMVHRFQDHDRKIQTNKDMCFDILSDQKTSQVEIRQLFERFELLETEQNELKENATKFDSAITDLQCRSMRDNLIFTGIEEPEYVEGVPEDTERTLRNFLEQEMNIDKPIPFHRVHRLNNYERSENYPRSIVAKFERFKDRELVRTQAPKTLKGKPFGVREQFPKVIEDKRKLLYPEMKRARENKQNKVRLVRDRLYINNSQYVPRSNQNADNAYNRGGYQQRYQRYENQSYSVESNSSVRENGARSSKGYNSRSRVYHRSSNQTHANGSGYRQQKQSYAAKVSNYSVSTSNRFSMLMNKEGNPHSRDNSETRKHKASSPLDADKSLKKHRENESSESDSDASQIEVDTSSNCDPATVQNELPASISLHQGSADFTPDANSSTDVVENQITSEA
ncbi:MAG: hypothetical protein AB2693_14170 [Candidatus Thiodiazotropha sp.]